MCGRYLITVAGLLLAVACGGGTKSSGGGTAPGGDDVSKCEAGDGEACENLGQQFDFGDDKNAPLAASYMQKACDLEVQSACVTLALWYSWGHGVERDGDKEYEMMEASCLKNYADACFWQGNGFNDFAKSIDPVFNDPEAERPENWEELVNNSQQLMVGYLQKACNLGDSNSCFILRHGVDEDPEIREGSQWYLPEGYGNEPLPEDAGGGDDY